MAAAQGVSFSEKDVENGPPVQGTQSRAASRKWSTAPGNIEYLDEYTALQKYISTYRDPKVALEEAAGEQEAEAARKQHPKWQFWRSKKAAAGPVDDGVVPEEWLDTDIRAGIDDATVLQRRKKFGFNEISTEKENMFLKFLGFFQGPILYGMSLFIFILSIV